MPVNVGDTYSLLPLRFPAIMMIGELEGDCNRFTQGDWSWISRLRWVWRIVQMEDRIHVTDQCVDSDMGTRMRYV